MQPDLTARVVDAFLLQQLVKPGQAVRAAVAMVAVIKADGTAPVAAQHRVGLGAQAAQGQQQKVARVAESMHHGAQALVPDVAKADQRLAVHATSSSAGALATDGALAND